MELQRAGRAFLRSTRTISDHFISPSSRPRCLGLYSINASRNRQATISQNFSTSANRRQQAAVAPPKPDANDQPNANRPLWKPAERAPDEFDDMLRGQTRKTTANLMQNASERTQGQWATGIPRKSLQQGRMVLSDLEGLASSSDDALLDTRKPISGSTASTAMPARQPINFPRLGPVMGRSIDVKNRDIRQALMQLDSLISRNRIRGLFQKQRFHERPGLKRKRLKSERWRKRFKEGFQHVTKRVERFVRQGW